MSRSDRRWREVAWRVVQYCALIWLALPIPADAQEVEFGATDGAVVFGTWHLTSSEPSAVIIALHQGGASGEGEYGPIIPRLLETGQNVLTVDLRAGGDLFGGLNRTVQARGVESEYCEAQSDIEGALAFVRRTVPGVPVILWGSSYSGALALRVAAEHPAGVAAVLAFSPASGPPMASCRAEDVASMVKVPVLVVRPRSETEREPVVEQLEIFRRAGHHIYVADPGTHGSSTLVTERVGAPATAAWDRVLRFLETNRE